MNESFHCVQFAKLHRILFSTISTSCDNNFEYFLQMVATDETPAQSSQDTGGTFGKLKQTLSSSLLTAQDKGKTIRLH